MPTQHSDIYNLTASAINYTGPGKTWTIANGVVVGSAGFPAVYSSFNGSKLVNKGLAFTHADVGVFFQVANHGTVINKAGASIVGDGGVTLGGVGGGSKNMTVMNDGSIVGTAGIGVGAIDVSNFDLTNTGHILGLIYGVFATVATPGATSGPMIENSGSISSAQVGVYVTMLPGLKATIINKSGGTIKGDGAAIETSAGNMLVENHGKLKGNVLGNAATDKIVNDGQIKGELYLGPGNDTFKNAGGTAGRVHGGDGNDTLIAGPHKDQFVFDTTLNAATNVDRVKHFDPGTDKLFLSKTYFPALSGPGNLASAEFHKGAAAHDGDDHIIYNKHTGALYYDPDGTGGSPQVEFAKLDKGLHLHASDFIVIA